MHAKLWTIARRGLVEQAHAAGRAYASWEYVPRSWAPAYRWMLARMRDRGLIRDDAAADVPPIWAWHSCDAWQQPPTHVTVDGLLGIEPCNRQGLYMVTWRASIERIVVSRYEVWCDLLNCIIAGTVVPAELEGDVLCPPGMTEPLPGFLPGSTLQACAPVLLREDIISVQPLESWT